jgi:hypothetical protein
LTAKDKEPYDKKSKEDIERYEREKMALGNTAAQEEIGPRDDHDILAAARAKFVQRNPRSLELHQKAIESLPGGNTRTLLHTAPFPLCMKSGKGYQVTDEDGHTQVIF